jgi:putative oxidoreductase
VTVDAALLIVRLAAGIVFAAHGAQKMFGAFEGPGLKIMMEKMGPVLGLLVSIGEFFGGLGLIVGFLTRFSAASLILIMVGAIVQVHGRNGFFLQNSGYEYNLALIGLLAPTLIAGPGWHALGRCLPLPKSKRTGRVIGILE